MTSHHLRCRGSILGMTPESQDESFAICDLSKSVPPILSEVRTPPSRLYRRDQSRDVSDASADSHRRRSVIRSGAGWPWRKSLEGDRTGLHIDFDNHAETLAGVWAEGREVEIERAIAIKTNPDWWRCIGYDHFR